MVGVVVLKRRDKIGAVIDRPSKAHRKMIQVLYPKRPDSQVTPLGTYRTSYGRVLPLKDRP